MKVHDLRSFLEVLRAAGQLVEISSEVDPVHELGAVLHACEQAGKASMFHRVKGHTIPVVGSLLGSHDRIALALECGRDEVAARVARATAEPIPPEIRTGGDIPSREVVVTDVDLGRFPVPTHAPGDAGPYLNAGVVIARELGGGRHNLSFNRMQVFEKDVTGVNINVWRHIREFFNAAEAAAADLPFCVALGVDPAVLMAAAFRYDGDEYEIAGGLRGAPIRVTPAMTCDVLVPVEAEIILECELMAGERRDEGPMAEFTGHYSGTDPQPVARIKAITHRTDPIFETIAGASFEHLIVGNAVTREPALMAAARRISPRVTAAHLPPYGSGFLALMAVDTADPGEARNVAIAALNSHVNVKTVMVFDADVDVHNPFEVLWALTTRVRWDQDLIRLPGAHGNELDPAADDHGVVCKVIVDATLPIELRGRYRKVRYPEVDLARYLPS